MAESSVSERLAVPAFIISRFSHVVMLAGCLGSAPLATAQFRLHAEAIGTGIVEPQHFARDLRQPKLKPSSFGYPQVRRLRRTCGKATSCVRPPVQAIDGRTQLSYAIARQLH